MAPWFLPAQFWAPRLEWDCLGQMFRVRPTPISHGDAADIQNGITFLSPVALSVCRASWLFPCSRQLRPAERPPEPSGQLGLKWEPSPAADVTMSLAGQASVWDVEGSVPLGLSWGRVTQGCFLCTFSLMDSERWAPPECDYRNNCLMLLLWLILKSSLSVSIDYFGSLAIHICPKKSFCWMTKETGS